jgi:hypothetical protein
VCDANLTSAQAQKQTYAPLGIPLADLPAGPVINICAITLGSLIYQFGEAATKLGIKNVFDAFYAFVMR